MADQPRPPLVPHPWRLVATAALVVALYYLVPMAHDRTALARAMGAVVVLGVLGAEVVRELRRSDDPIGRLITVLLLVVLTFASIFYALSLVPGQFEGLHTRTDALYFTLVTIATIGYGDVHPTGQTARAVTTVAIVFNLVFVAALASTISTRLRQHLTERAEVTPPRERAHTRHIP